ncbi:MAG: alpha/beta hydrolase [Hyphomonadaceae bacterium]
MRKLMSLLLVATLSACNATEDTSAVDLPPTNVSAAEGSMITVTRSGNRSGRTVVLIPGLASSAQVWDATRPSLETDYDVRTVQVAGFAGADVSAVDGLYTDAIAAALVAELQETPANQAVLVGHSMGGFVSMKAALAAPDLVDELVIVDSVPFLSGLFFPGATPESAAAQAPAMAAQMAGMPREAFDAQQRAGLGRLVKTAASIPTLAAWGETSDQSVVSAITGEVLAADLRADIAAMQAETLVLVPHDAAMGVSRDQAEQTYQTQYQAAPNVGIQVIDNSFHFIMIDQRDAFHTSLLAALAD